MRWFTPNIEKFVRKQQWARLLATLHDGDPSLRVEAARAMFSLSDPQFVPALTAALADPDMRVRYEAARALGARKDVRLLSTLLPLLADAEPHVRHQTVEALSKIGKLGIGPLLATLQFEKSALIRQGILTALGEMGAEETVVRAFIALLGDPSRPVRTTAAEQLAQVGLFALPLLVEALQTEDAEMRAHVRSVILGMYAESSDQALMLEKLIALLVEGSERARLELSSFVSRVARAALEPLIRALSRPQAALRTWARRMLAGVQWQPVTEEEHIAWLWASEDWTALQEHGAAALTPLLDGLVHGPAHARRAIAQTLGGLHEPRAVDGLLVAAQQDHDYTVRTLAVQALGQLGDARAIAPLLALGEETVGQPEATHFRTTVTTALLQFGPAVQPVVQERAPHPDPAVQQWRALLQEYCSHAPRETSSAAGARDGSARPHCLVVEDDASTQLLIRRTLERHGYGVSVADNGLEALWQLGSQSFAVILSDITMPQLDGLQLLRFLQQKRLPTPVIFLTAQVETADELQGLALGAFDYLKKPVHPAVLLQRVQRALVAPAPHAA